MMSLELAAAIAELKEWTAGGRSHWNDLHGSVTGDYAGMFTATATADAAQIEFLMQKVRGIQLAESIEKKVAA